MVLPFKGKGIMHGVLSLPEQKLAYVFEISPFSLGCVFEKKGIFLHDKPFLHEKTSPPDHGPEVETPRRA